MTDGVYEQKLCAAIDALFLCMSDDDAQIYCCGGPEEQRRIQMKYGIQFPQIEPAEEPESASVIQLQGWKGRDG